MNAQDLNVQQLYDELCKYWSRLAFLLLPVLFFYDAPFGKFAKNHPDSWLTVDGIKSWIIMELPSPLTLVLTFSLHPLSSSLPSNPATKLLLLLWLIHYSNRALISPLRTPSRSKFHIIIPFCAICFNLINGFLNGAYFSSEEASAMIDWSTPGFWIGVAVWAFGFIGNVVHDEILLNLRRSSGTKNPQGQNGSANGAAKSSPGQEHYSIPYGLLYTYVSYPNYFCEWLEWIGFAYAASPHKLYTPPWMFVAAEVFTMVGRAVSGHKWYKQRFGKEYPQERKAVVPFIL